METYYIPLKNFRKNIKKIKETTINFNFNGTKLLFFPKHYNYVNMFLKNLNNITFEKEIFTEWLETKENVDFLKEKEKIIKEKVFDYIKNLIEKNNINLEEIKSIIINNLDSEWVIKDMELGTLLKFIKEIDEKYKMFSEKSIIELLEDVFKITNKEEFEKSFIIFSNYRNGNYHYNTEDQILLLGALQLLERDLKEKGQKQNGFFTIKKEINKEFQLIYQNHDYFKESLEIFKQIQKTMI